MTQGAAMSAGTAPTLARRLAILPLLSLLACGGGSGSHIDFTLTFTPAQLTAHYFHNQRSGQNSNSNVTASINGTIDPLPTANLYVVIAADAPVFQGDVSLTPTGGNGFTVSLSPNTSLSTGTHSGTLTIRMYQDAGLTKEYSVKGGKLPYTLTVDPELTVTVKIDGVLQSQTFSSSNTGVTAVYGNTIYWYSGQPAAAFTLPPGKVIELEASIPVTWRSPDTFSSYGYLWSAPTVTPTTLTQTLAAPPNGSPAMYGNAFIALPATADQFGAGLIIDIQP
jgi:hypothetical protein